MEIECVRVSRCANMWVTYIERRAIAIRFCFHVSLFVFCFRVCFFFARFFFCHRRGKIEPLLLVWQRVCILIRRRRIFSWPARHFCSFFFCPRAFRFAFVLCRFVCFFSFFGFDSFRVASAFGGGPFFGAHSPFLPFIEFDFACFSLFFALFFAFAGSPLTAKRGCVRKYAVRNNSIDTAAMVGEQCRRSIETLMEFEGNRSL